MEKHSNRDDLIAALAEDLTPTARVNPRDGMLLIVFAALAAALASVAIFEFWPGMIGGQASAFFWITNGLLGLLGTASMIALVQGALPRVGMRGNAPFWSAGMLAVVPIAAIITLISVEAGHDHGTSFADPALSYWQCAAYGLAASSLIGVAAVVWLRRGAPVSIERSAWLTGLTAGAFGSLAYGITCPLDGIAHVGIVHVAPIAIAALIARVAVPPLIRW